MNVRQDRAKGASAAEDEPEGSGPSFPLQHRYYLADRDGQGRYASEPRIRGKDRARPR
ncbi:hypothetical protein LCGC14_2034080, partial [marine sediment metagenome]